MALNLWRHLLLVLVICLAVAVLYANVTRAYFCAYDDFIEVHRAAFEDSQQPSRVFTTSHFNSYKYRPLNRLVVLLTYWAGGPNPLFFRIRNLAFHLINVALVYTLSWALFQSMPISALGALFFAVHPMVNQSVIGAAWTNTIAHTAFLLSLWMFTIALRSERWVPWLVGALISGYLSLMTLRLRASHLTRVIPSPATAKITIPSKITIPDRPIRSSGGSGVPSHS